MNAAIRAQIAAIRAAEPEGVRVPRDQDVREHCRVCGNAMIEGKAEAVCGQCGEEQAG